MDQDNNNNPEDINKERKCNLYYCKANEIDLHYETNKMKHISFIEVNMDITLCILGLRSIGHHTDRDNIMLLMHNDDMETKENANVRESTYKLDHWNMYTNITFQYVHINGVKDKPNLHQNNKYPQENIESSNKLRHNKENNVK